MSEKDIQGLFAGANVPLERVSGFQRSSAGKFYTYDVSREFLDVLNPPGGFSYQQAVARAIDDEISPFHGNFIVSLKSVSEDAAMLWGQIADITKGKEFYVEELSLLIGMPIIKFGDLMMELYCASLMETLDDECAVLLPAPLSKSLTVWR